MKRVDLFNILNEIAPTYSVGQIKSTIAQDCMILRRGVDLPSVNNALGHWESWSIDIYSATSPNQVDRIVETIKARFTPECEIETLTSGDYYDEILRAFSTTITIRIPKIY